MRLEQNIPLAPLTTLGLGGPARTLVRLEQDQELPEILDGVWARRDRLCILGGGSNMVVADEGFTGTVLQIATRGVEVREEDSQSVLVEAAAGEDWDSFVAVTVKQGWVGLETLSGIPGQVGASPIQNIGAYGSEVCETIESLTAFDSDNGSIVEFKAKECGFAYRASCFKHHQRYIVTRVRYRLKKAKTGPVRYRDLVQELQVSEGASVPIVELREAVLRIRRKKSMLYDRNDPDSWSAGSFMTNPIVSTEQLKELEARAGQPVPNFAAGPGGFKVPAAWLIEHAGYSRGLRRGGVGISSKHCLALVNLGSGTAKELLALADEIREKVRNDFGIELALEPVIIR